jgi:DNA-binding CsgD family transcriptional regulator
VQSKNKSETEAELLGLLCFGKVTVKRARQWFITITPPHT